MIRRKIFGPLTGRLPRAIRIIQNLIGNVQKKPPNIELTDIIIDLDNLKDGTGEDLT